MCVSIFQPKALIVAAFEARNRKLKSSNIPEKKSDFVKLYKKRSVRAFQ